MQNESSPEQVNVLTSNRKGWNLDDYVALRTSDNNPTNIVFAFDPACTRRCEEKCAKLTNPWYYLLQDSTRVEFGLR